jgi:membrane-bound lytic murein transglycosylase D
MPETAREYGLIVNDNVDERYNFEKSTIAAAKYLNYLHTLF